MTQPVPFRPKESGPMAKMYKPGTQPGGKFGICIYGRGGVGKTTLLKTMPGKGMVVDVPQIEGGTFVLEEAADHIDIVPVDEWNQIEEVFDFLKAGNHDYRWVAIDSITAFQELSKRRTIRERQLHEDPNMISQREYGVVGRRLGELVYKFRTLPIHTIWIAQERRTRDEETGSDRVGPDLIPSALSMLSPSMMMVGRMTVEPGADGWERHLNTSPQFGKMRAKPRASEKPFPIIVRNPNLGHMLAYALGAAVPRPDEVDESGVVLG